MARCISSVERLEILCLLAESPSKAWSSDEVFRVIQSTERTVKASLAEFAKTGLVAEVPADTFRFAPAQSGLGAAALALARAYRERPVAVIETIYKRPAAQTFADAFRLRKDT